MKTQNITATAILLCMCTAAIAQKDSATKKNKLTISTRKLGIEKEQDLTFIKDSDTLHLYDSTFIGLETLDSQVHKYSVFMTGENHSFTESNSKIWLKMIKYLHTNAGVRNIMFEYGFAYGYLVNEYLQTGDTSLFQSISLFAYTEYGKSLKELKEFNDSLPEDEKIYFAGIDVDRGLFPIAKVLSHLLPSDSIEIPDSIKLHVKSLRSLAAYNDFKLDEVEGILYSRGFAFKTGATLELIHENFKNNIPDYMSYLGDDFALFEDVIMRIYTAREKWQDLENSGAIQEYVFREDYMHEQFLKEYKEHKGNWFGQFGRCHTTKMEQENNSCEWFHFNSLAQRIKETQGGTFEDKVMTLGIVYDTDRNFGDSREQDEDLLQKYFDDLSENSVALVDLTTDSSLSITYGTDFDYLIFNTYNGKGEAYSYLDYYQEPTEQKGKVLLNFGRRKINLNSLNEKFIEDGGSGDLTNNKDALEVSIMGGDNKNVSGTSLGVYIGDSTGLDNLVGHLHGWYVNSLYYYNVLSKKKWVDVLLGGGFGYQRLKLSIPETGTINTSKAFLGTKKNTFFINDAVTAEFSGLVDINIGRLTIRYSTGYTVDLSKKNWKSDGEILEDSPKTSFNGWYQSMGIGFNF